MAKRFTATEKWKDLWFKKLSPENKLLWIYMLDECDNAGLIELDLEMAGLLTGYSYSKLDLLENFGSRLIQVTEDVWFIPKFILFQYPKGLGTTDNNIKNVVMKLKKHNLVSPTFDLTLPQRRSSIDPQDMDKDKDKEMDKDKDMDKGQKVEILAENKLSSEIVEKQTETGVAVRKFVLQTEMKGLFEDYYKSKKGVMYYYDGKSAGNLKQIIQKIRAVSPKEEVSDEQVLTAWKYILLNLNDTWVLDNLDLNIINSKFNTIISKIKNGSTNSNGTHETVGGTAKGFDPRKNTWFARAVENYIQSERENGNLP